MEQEKTKSNKTWIILIIVVASAAVWWILSAKPSATPTAGLPQPAPSTSALSASPTSGVAPLVMTFTSIFGDPTSQPASWSDGVDTNLDFGDDTNSVWMQCPGSDAERQKIAQQFEEPGFIWFRCSIQVQHTYYKAGTYTAKLIHAGGFCPEPGCGTTNLDTVTITVK